MFESADKFFLLFIFLFSYFLVPQNLQAKAPNDLSYPYPLASSRWRIPKNSSSLRLDKRGVVEVKLHGSFRYYPITIARKAVAAYKDYFRNGTAEAKVFLLRQADWMLESMSIKDGRGILFADFDNPQHHAKAPWASAMANGLALGAMVGAFTLSQDERYRDGAKKLAAAFSQADTHSVYNSFRVTTSKQLSLQTENAGTEVIWYEEVVSDHPTHILNGHIFALAGLENYLQIASEENSIKLTQIALKKGIEAVSTVLPLFDLGFTSSYDLGSYTYADATGRGAYNLIHVDQLLWLYHISKYPIFIDYAKKFMSYDTSQKSAMRALGWETPQLRQMKTKIINSDWSDKKKSNCLFDGRRYWGETLTFDSAKDLLDIDLGKDTPIIGIVFYTSKDPGYVPKIFSVSVSTQAAATMDVIIEGQRLPKSWGVHAYKDKRTFVSLHVFEKPAIGRYIRIRLAKGVTYNESKLRELTLLFDRSEDVNARYTLLKKGWTTL